jgi:hypothetical protein
MDDLKNELCKRINQRINVRGYCVVYDHELGHIWPPEAALREKQIQLIEKFAEQNGLAVTIRDTGINATFKKKATPHEQVKPDLKTLPDSKSRTQVSRNKTAVKLGRFGGPISTHTSDARVGKAVPDSVSQSCAVLFNCSRGGSSSKAKSARAPLSG